MSESGLGQGSTEMDDEFADFDGTDDLDGFGCGDDSCSFGEGEDFVDELEPYANAGDDDPEGVYDKFYLGDWEEGMSPTKYLSARGSGALTVSSADLHKRFDGLTYTDIAADCAQYVMYVCKEVRNVSRELALILLRQNNWDRMVVVDKLKKDFAQAMNDAGVGSGPAVGLREGETDVLMYNEPCCFYCGKERHRKTGKGENLGFSSTNLPYRRPLPLSVHDECSHVLGIPSTVVDRHYCPVCGEELDAPVKEKAIPNGDEEVECGICFDDVPLKDTFALRCGHRFCRSCWAMSMKTHIEKLIGVMDCQMYCPCAKCRCPVPDCVFAFILKDKDLLKRYVKFSLHGLVNAKESYKFCPCPDCQAVVWSSEPKSFNPVTCSNCHFKYCFHCSDYSAGDHKPCPCKEYAEWVKKETNNDDSIRWMQANTKQCPKCKSPIEKNEGCNHMTCGICRYEFCWLCRGPWAEHGTSTGGFYQCNRYNSSDAKKIDDANDITRKEIERYMFFYHRFDSHKQARRRFEKLLASLDDRRLEIVKKFHTRPSETNFLSGAYTSVLAFLRALQYSYAYAYYIPKGPKSDLFQYNQGYLERFTDEATELLEKPLAAITDFPKWRKEIIDKVSITNKYLDNFTRSIDEETK